VGFDRNVKQAKACLLHALSRLTAFFAHFLYYKLPVTSLSSLIFPSIYQPKGQPNHDIHPPPPAPQDQYPHFSRTRSKRIALFTQHKATLAQHETLHNDIQAAKAKHSTSSSQIDDMTARMERLTADLQKLTAEQQRDLRKAKKLMMEVDARRAEARAQAGEGARRRCVRWWRGRDRWDASVLTFEKPENGRRDYAGERDRSAEGVTGMALTSCGGGRTGWTSVPDEDHICGRDRCDRNDGCEE
ncbi:hypothetical protein LTR95_016635, partial [Oleoguttula sp. CCFEE 5521]